MIYTTIYRKLNIEQLEPNKTPGVNSGVPEGSAVSLMGLVALILLKIRDKSCLRKGHTCDYDKWTISVDIVTQLLYNDWRIMGGGGGDCEALEANTSP